MAKEELYDMIETTYFAMLRSVKTTLLLTLPAPREALFLGTK